MKDYPVLYTFRRCPYAIRARMALRYSAIQYELREVVLRDKPEQMLAISQKGTVPVLELQDGTIIDESLDVMLWSLKQSDPDNWLMGDKEATEELIEKNDNQFKHYLDRYKYFQNHPEKPQEYYRAQAEEVVSAFDDNLRKHQGVGLVEERMTFADVAIFPFVRQFAHVDWDWFSQSQYQYLIEWLVNFEESDLFLSVMKKYKPWQKDHEAVLI